jgi:RsiW-degrading membrane proteinase PrsW (M82 family)
VTCQHCGRESAPAPFCTFCGTRQGSVGRPAAGRRGDRYAAHPNEGVLHPSVVTTLFPHLGHHKVNEFRWALLIGAAVLVVLYVVGLIAAAILAGAVLVPVVYLVYLYEARVYRDAPVRVIGLTLGGGAVLGVVVTLIGDALSSTAPLIRSTPFGLSIDVASIVLFLVVVPIVSEVVKPLPALLLRGSSDFPETVDGLVFGISAGLGFAAAETILHFSRVITSGDIQTTPGTWIFPIITLSVLTPLLQGSATGLITAALWRRRSGALGRLAMASIAVALVGHVVFDLGSELLDALGPSPLIALVWQAAIVGSLLVAVRILLHHALLEEAEDLGLSAGVCPNCGSHVTSASFCPVCGMAMRAAPREGPSKPRRTSRPARAEGA